MTQEKDLVKMTVRAPRPVYEGIDKSIGLGIYPSKNQFFLETSLQTLRLVLITLSIIAEVKKNAKKPLEFYALFGKAMQNQLTPEALDSCFTLASRTALAVDKSSTDEIEEIIKKLEALIGEKNKEATHNGVVPNDAGDP